MSAKSLKVTADDKSVVYGDGIPEFTAVFDGLYGDDSFEATYNCNYEQGSHAGEYTITVTELNANGQSQKSDYDVTYETGMLTVSQRTFSITVENETIAFGDDAPHYSVSVFGAYANEGFNYDILCDYSKGDDPGTYDITVTIIGTKEGTDNNDYKIVIYNGTLTVNSI